MPDNLPKAFQSALWPYLDEIRALRRSRKMWVEIAQHLEQKHGIKMTYRAVRNFFVRATSPNRRIPAGLEEYLGAKPTAPVPAPAPAQPADSGSSTRRASGPPKEGEDERFSLEPTHDDIFGIYRPPEKP